ncbi:hypothetical protein CYJ37_21605 [Bacillus sp. UMB0728]|nr:hypothetical protein B9K06_10395 [Bacillus sp. OG2]PLR70625.1 hypothetical protein CYJ37_21605 [Bacillus sp. UMB0728]
MRNISDPLIYERAKGELLMDAPLFLALSCYQDGSVIKAGPWVNFSHGFLLCKKITEIWRK